MHVFETWQIEQLERIGRLTPIRMEEFLQTVWSRYPALYEELAINALDNGSIDLAGAAERLNLTEESVLERLDHLHATGDHRIDIINGVAKLVSCNIAVWEVFREFRESATLDQLNTSFPSIPMSELRAALRYAEAHPVEIEEQINEFETAYAKRYIG